jgi:predicted transcriptional regulator
MRQLLTIKPHSFIDIITNSSTEIYVSVGDWSVNTLKDLVNGMLKIAKSDKTCDDLFEISVNNYRCEEWILDQIGDYYLSDRMTCDEYKVLTDDENIYLVFHHQ